MEKWGYVFDQENSVKVGIQWYRIVRMSDGKHIAFVDGEPNAQSLVAAHNSSLSAPAMKEEKILPNGPTLTPQTENNLP